MFGLSTGLVYGVIEFALAVAVPSFWSKESTLLSWQWPVIATLFLVYAAAGLLCGAVGGMWFARKGSAASSEQLKILMCAILALAFAANLAAAWPLKCPENIALILAGALALVFGGALTVAPWQRRMAFLASPAVLSLLLLSGPWASRAALGTNASALRKAVVSLAAIGTVLGFAALRQRILPSPTYKTRIAASLAILGCLWVLQTRKTTAATGQEPSGPSLRQNPNIVLITMDTVRADHLSIYGYQHDTTPFLREFARGATLYERAIATNGYTIPTHASLFTGLYSSWHGATVHPGYPNDGSPLPPRTTTLASVLRAHGYWTIETIANYVGLGAWTGLTQGFASTESKRAVRIADPNRPFYLREGARKLLFHFVNVPLFHALCLRAGDINRDAFAVLEEVRIRNKPFFLFLNYMDAHRPYLAPEPFYSRFRDKNLPPITAEALGSITEQVNNGIHPLDNDDKRYLVSQYDGGIAYMDSEIKNLVDRLRKLGLYDNTMIVITADHGEAFGEHNRMSHAIGSVYEDQIYVPLLIKYPHQQESRRCHDLVSQVDFMPTVLAATGLPVPGGVQGRNLLSPSNSGSSTVFAEGVAAQDSYSNSRLRGLRRAVLTGPWKLITWSDGAPELYNLADDPGELHNLYPSDKPVASELQTRLTLWARAIPHRGAPRHHPAIDPADVERLKSLGYIQ